MPCIAREIGFSSVKRLPWNKLSKTGRVMTCWASISMASASEIASLRSSCSSLRKASKVARASGSSRSDLILVM